MSVRDRMGGDIRRARTSRRRPLAAFVRGLLIAGLAGTAWCLSAAAAHAAVTDDFSPVDLAPMTASSLGEAVATSVQAAYPTQSNQLDVIGSPLLDAPVEGAAGTSVPRSAESSVVTCGNARGEALRVSTDTEGGQGNTSRVEEDTWPKGQSGSTSESAVPTSDAPLGLVEDAVEPIGLDGVVAAPSAPLSPIAGLMRPVSAPLASAARPVIDPLTETVSPMTDGMGAVTQPVVGVLNRVTTPVATVVTPMSASLAQVAPIVPDLPGGVLGTFAERPDDAHDAANRHRVTPAQALLHTARYSAEYRPGAERGNSSHDAAVSSGMTGRHPFGPLPLRLPTTPDLGFVTGGALSGSGAGATMHDGGAATASNNLLADARLNRVAPATAAYGPLSIWISDPAVSPD
ncbi:hypothetical protein Afil01_60350 [Actinorhabdospora filicis]|uniref:Uncharacterized protein n=1 Tax=Actinorhabdospora filicis TaxID=1785913 RepID=A0A9W6SRW9_9ACTN|nr:hypothetical protein [Actinorhabdospora filicis]GLZ81228.1 hypothetical protein Afil01_60350 [Actinorhabdospora filicis]